MELLGKTSEMVFRSVGITTTACRGNSDDQKGLGGAEGGSSQRGGGRWAFISVGMRDGGKSGGVSDDQTSLGNVGAKESKEGAG
jgi:hypothetical protein